MMRKVRLTTYVTSLFYVLYTRNLKVYNKPFS